MYLRYSSWKHLTLFQKRPQISFLLLWFKIFLLSKRRVSHTAMFLFNDRWKGFNSGLAHILGRLHQNCLNWWRRKQGDVEQLLRTPPRFLCSMVSCVNYERCRVSGREQIMENCLVFWRRCAHWKTFLYLFCNVSEPIKLLNDFQCIQEDLVTEFSPQRFSSSDIMAPPIQVPFSFPIFQLPLKILSVWWSKKTFIYNW